MSKKDTIRLFKEKLTNSSVKTEVNEAPVVDPRSNVEMPQQTGTPLGTDDVPSGTPVEISDKIIKVDTLDMMNTSAAENSVNAKEDHIEITVTEIEKFNIGTTEIKYFYIIDKANTDKNAYAIYQIADKIYYRPLKEFLQLMKDAEDKIPGISINSFKNKYDKVREPLDSVYSVADRDDCSFVVCSIFSSITGKSYDNSLLIDQYIDESCKIIRHTKLSSDGIFKNSKQAYDAKYGTADKIAFRREIEDKQKQDNTVGALDDQQQESAGDNAPRIPNVHRKMVSEKIVGVDIDAIYEAKSEDIYYEPHDRVLVKTANGDIPGMVTDVYDNLEYGQVLTVLCQGSTVNVTTKEVRPDMSYLVNQLADYTDEFSDIAFEIDKETRLNKKVENDKKDYSKDYKDLNDVEVLCDIVVNGFKVNYDIHRASLKDIAKSNKFIKVVSESGGAEMWPIQSIAIAEKDWPYAVIVSTVEDNDEPQRKIRINPTSYVEAGEDDLVDCIMGDERTQVAKKNIRIIS